MRRPLRRIADLLRRRSGSQTPVGRSPRASGHDLGPGRRCGAYRPGRPGRLPECRRTCVGDPSEAGPACAARCRPMGSGRDTRPSRPSVHGEAAAAGRASGRLAVLAWFLGVWCLSTWQQPQYLPSIQSRCCRVLASPRRIRQPLLLPRPASACCCTPAGARADRRGAIAVLLHRAGAARGSVRRSGRCRPRHRVVSAGQPRAYSAWRCWGGRF